MTYRILIDTNVILDFLAIRNPFFETSCAIINACTTGGVKGGIAAHSVMNAYYVLRKYYTVKERCAMLIELAELLEIVPIHHANIMASLNNDISFDDIEDCLQDQCADDFHADYIITRNTKDFVHSIIPAITPEAFLDILKSEQQ